MPNIGSLESVYLALGLFVPGFITLSVRSQFVTGRRRSHSEDLLSYFTVSLIYYALSFPFVGVALSLDDSFYSKMLAWFALIFVGPAVLGFILGINVQTDWVRRALRRCGLNPVHVIPAAWDWKFGRMANEWVLVTLKDGTRFAGFCGEDSFISSDPHERDIYIQWVYDIDPENNWSSRGDSGVLIASGEVRTIEFWPYTPEENPDDHE